MNICKQCSKETKNPNFCSSSCSATYNNKLRKHSQETKDKITKAIHKLYPPVIKLCEVCGMKFKTGDHNNQKYCSIKCSNKRKISQEFRDKISVLQKERCSKPKEKQRLRDIGRKGGFGKKGYTKNGTRFDSMFEQKCFQYLEDNKIVFEPHKHIPNSSKISDIYFPDKNLYIELDGINREKKHKWLESEYGFWRDKLNIYKEQNLNYLIFYTFEEFIKYMQD